MKNNGARTVANKLLKLPLIPTKKFLPLYREIYYFSKNFIRSNVSCWLDDQRHIIASFVLAKIVSVFFRYKPLNKTKKKM